MHSISITQIFKKLKTSDIGLSSKEVKIRLQKQGLNQLPKSREKITKINLFFSQFKSSLMWLLIIAGVISGLLQEFIDMTVILITVFINIGLGFFQEYKANKSLEKLASLIKFQVIVLRDGKPQKIPAEEIVVGDILLVEAGDKIQADARLISAKELQMIESALTGESEPQSKSVKILKSETVLADRENMIYSGTVVANGRAKAVVIATGKNTEIGKIASLVSTTRDQQTPLQIQLAKMSRIITWVVVFICLVIFIVGIFSNSSEKDVFYIFETAVAVAVAAIPEGMVISLTIILAIGMQFILKRNALVRKLVATETLGSVSVICTDKTGTLTEGKMRLTHLVTANNSLNYEEISLLNKENNDHPDSLFALKIGALANNGILLNSSAKPEDWKLIGDSTDTALVYAAQKAGIDKELQEKVNPRIDEISFDSQRKFMATLHNIDHESVLYLKGSSEFIFKNASLFEEAGEAKTITAEKLAWFKDQEKKLTSHGLRVLGVAYKRFEGNIKKINEKSQHQVGEAESTSADLTNLVLVGLVGLSDPVRPQIKETIALAQLAGIRTVMITGDHVKTAQAIAKVIGIPHKNSQIFDGERLEKITDKELTDAIKNIFIFARVDPKHKIRIVQAWQKNGEVVAMTGDGINDAPAIKAADIGIALGSGTDVAKEISDMVLLDNNYNTIVEAVAEGRTIYQNIKKVVLYLLSGSFAEATLILGSMVAGMPLAALPVQILWVNIIEDTFPNIALAFERGDKENMSDPPRKKKEKIIDKEIKTMIIAKSVLANLALFLIFIYFYQTTGNIELTRTIVFVGFAIDSLFFIFAIRSLRRPIWRINFWGNKYLIGAVLIGWVMLVSAVYAPFLQILLKTVPLNLGHWVLMIGFGMFNLALIEVVKAIFIYQKNYNSSSVI